MVNIYSKRKNFILYYDLANKRIGRFPTKSNLLTKGSDNSIYVGSTSDEDITSIILKLFNLKTVDELSNKTFEMLCGTDNVKVVLNINKEGQIQLKLLKDGLLSKIVNKNLDKNPLEQLIVFDFINKTIAFKDPKEMDL